MRCTNGLLFDHLIGATEEREGWSQTERLGGLQIDNQFHSHFLLYRQVGRLLALENAARIDAGHTLCVVVAAAIAH